MVLPFPTLLVGRGRSSLVNAPKFRTETQSKIEDMEKQFIEIKTTCDDQEVLKKIAKALLEAKLAACVQIGKPVVSSYHWQGKLESKKEWTLEAKSISYLTNNAMTVIQEHHSYDEPEIVSTQFTPVSDGYAIWLLENLAS